MDRADEELKLLGFFGIIKESFKITFSGKKIFSKISLALILPLSFIYLAHMAFSELIFGKTVGRDTILEDGPTVTRDYSHVKSSAWAGFWTFQAACLVIYIILALLSTSAVVYSIACIYTNKETSFRKVMGVVPKVWKRLMDTFMWSFILIFVYNVISIMVLGLFAVLTGLSPVGVVFFIILVILYLLGNVYIGVLWHLASVISVLEEIRGRGALKKSKVLIKGKLGVSGAIFVLFVVLFFGIELLVEIYVVIGLSGGLGVRILVGIASLLMLCKLILFALVTQTVIYFVCKSYHNEIIDKSSLAYHLEVNLGDYVPLRDNNIQLQEVHP